VKILVSASPGEVRVAACEDRALVDYAIWRPGAPDGVGDLYRGRVVARVPAMAGAFVELGHARGFLPDTQGGASAGEGTILGVRITRAAQGGKGPRLTAHLSKDEPALVGSGPPALLRRGRDVVQRLGALHPKAPIVVDDAALAAQLRPVLGSRLEQGTAFDDDIEAAVEALGEPVAELPGGARLWVYPTPALTALDVDLASATADPRAKRAAQMAANAELVGEVARQIRLRNLGGAIMLDFGGMKGRRRAILAPILSAALAADPLRPRLLGFTALGLAEIVRPRIHPPLAELLSGPHAAGLAALRRAVREVAARPALALRLFAAPAVITALRADPVALPDFTRRAGRELVLYEDRALSPFGWTLEEANRV
jgi:Ribonuclease G/E